MIGFIIGIFVGGLLSVFFMAILQVNKNEAKQTTLKSEEEGCTCGDDSHHGSKEHLATFKESKKYLSETYEGVSNEELKRQWGYDGKSKQWQQGFDAKLRESEKDRKNLEQVCYLAVSHGVISRWKCAEIIGINLAEMDDWFRSYQSN